MLKAGHRGIPALAAENTIDGFEAALHHGATALEFDVRACADNLVVVHDATLLRTHGQDVNIAHATAAQLATYGVPTLQQVLLHFAHQCYLFIELKEQPIGADVARLLAPYDLASITVISFYPRALEGVFATNPHIRLGANCCYDEYDEMETPFFEITRGREAESIVQILSTHPYLSSIQPKHTCITPDIIHAAHAQHRHIYTWTVNNERRAHELTAHGIDGIITDDVRILA